MAKITIIGAGVVGGAIAYELSKNTQNTITLIDQNPPAQGCTSAALGVLMGIISRKIKGRAWQLRQTSIERYKTLIPELENLTGEKIIYNSQGIVKLLFPEDDLTKWEKLSQIRESQGWNLEIWNTTKLQEKLPQLEIINNKIVGAIYSPQDGQINPTNLTETLIKAAKINGVICEFGQKVQKIEITPVNGEKTRESYNIYLKEQKLDTDILIITAGLGTTFLTQLLAKPVEIKPVLGQAIQLKLDVNFGHSNFQPVITGDDVHIVPLGNNEYWVGATLEFSDAQGEILEREELLKQVQDRAIAFCPSLAKATIIRQWSGKRPRPEQQSAPIITKLDGYDNIILATGHYRNGVLLAPATALKVKEMLSH